MEKRRILIDEKNDIEEIFQIEEKRSQFFPFLKLKHPNIIDLTLDTPNETIDLTIIENNNYNNNNNDNNYFKNKSTTTKPPFLLDLPQEVFVNILLFCDPKSIFSLKLTCSRIHNIIMEYEGPIWRNAIQRCLPIGIKIETSRHNYYWYRLFRAISVLGLHIGTYKIVHLNTISSVVWISNINPFCNCSDIIVSTEQQQQIMIDLNSNNNNKSIPSENIWMFKYSNNNNNNNNNKIDDNKFNDNDLLNQTNKKQKKNENKNNEIIIKKNCCEFTRNKKLCDFCYPIHRHNQTQNKNWNVIGIIKLCQKKVINWFGNRKWSEGGWNFHAHFSELDYFLSFRLENILHVRKIETLSEIKKEIQLRNIQIDKKIFLKPKYLQYSILKKILNNYLSNKSFNGIEFRVWGFTNFSNDSQHNNLVLKFLLFICGICKEKNNCCSNK